MELSEEAYRLPYGYGGGIFLLNDYLMTDRCHDERKFIITVRQAVFRQRKGSPAGDTAQTHLCLVNQYVGQRSLFYLIGVVLGLFPS